MAGIGEYAGKGKKNPWEPTSSFKLRDNPLNKLASKKTLSTTPIYSSPLKQREVKEYDVQTDAPEIQHADEGSYGTTLYSYFKGQGQNLPSVQERGGLYEKLGLGSAGDYKGTSAQNKELFNLLTTKQHTDVYKGDDLRKETITGIDYTGEKTKGKTVYASGGGEDPGEEFIRRNITVDSEGRNVEGGDAQSRIGKWWREGRDKRQARRERKQVLRDEGSSRKEARQQVREEMPRKKRTNKKDKNN